MDEEIRDNVELALNSLLTVALLVSVKDGVVVLEGAVETDGEFVEAERQAWRVAGVKEVINKLDVVPPVVSLEGLQAEESEIVGKETDMDAVGEAEPYYPPTDPVVWPSATSEEGLEVRGGFAPDALDDTNPPHSHETGTHGDDEITDGVLRALSLNAITADRAFEVETVDGVVRLRGRVSSFDEAEEAEALAATVQGVAEVIEELEIE